MLILVFVTTSTQLIIGSKKKPGWWVQLLELIIFFKFLKKNRYQKAAKSGLEWAGDQGRDVWCDQSIAPLRRTASTDDGHPFLAVGHPVPGA